MEYRSARRREDMPRKPIDDGNAEVIENRQAAGMQNQSKAGITNEDGRGSFDYSLEPVPPSGGRRGEKKKVITIA